MSGGTRAAIGARIHGSSARASCLQLWGAMTIRDVLRAPSAGSLLAGGCALVALAAVTLAPAHVRPVEAPVLPPLPLLAPEPAVAVHEVAVALEDAAPEPAPADPRDSLRAMASIEDPADFTFVIEVGGTSYLQIGDFAVAADRDSAELADDGYATAAVAPIAARALPEELQRWKGRQVIVGGTCTATVIGFAEIARVSGDPRLALSEEERITEERTDVPWTVERVFSAGSTMIAAELDRHCAGSWARATDRPAVGRALEIDDTRLERAARRAFLASAYADVIAAGWRAAEQPGDWRDHVTLEARIVKHSITGARWAYVHALRPGGCGEHEVNVMAIYQVAADGALTEIETEELPGRALEALVDLNGDGWLERLVVHGGPSDRSLVGPVDSTTLASIHVALLGCGC